MIKIGITGSIASGKSTVSKILSKKKYLKNKKLTDIKKYLNSLKF